MVVGLDTIASQLAGLNYMASRVVKLPPESNPLLGLTLQYGY